MSRSAAQQQAAEDACSPVAKQQKLDFSRRQQPTTRDRELWKQVAGYVVDISTTDSHSFQQITEKIPVRGNRKLPGEKMFASYHR